MELLKFWTKLVWDSILAIGFTKTGIAFIVLSAIFGGIVFLRKKGWSELKNHIKQFALFTVGPSIAAIIVIFVFKVFMLPNQFDIDVVIPISSEESNQGIKEAKRIIKFGTNLFNSEHGALRSAYTDMTPGMRKLRNETLVLFGKFNLKNTPLGQIQNEIVATKDISGAGDLFKEKCSYIDKHVEAVRSLEQYLENQSDLIPKLSFVDVRQEVFSSEKSTAEMVVSSIRLGVQNNLENESISGVKVKYMEIEASYGKTDGLLIPLEHKSGKTEVSIGPLDTELFHVADLFHRTTHNYRSIKLAGGSTILKGMNPEGKPNPDIYYLKFRVTSNKFPILEDYYVLDWSKNLPRFYLKGDRKNVHR